MHRCRAFDCLRRGAGRLTVAAGLVGFVVANLGVPIVQPAAHEQPKDKSKPFPCQNRPCGCMSAGDCFRSCCCFSARQRLAWARDHEVEAPPELIAAADEEHECADHGHDEQCRNESSASSAATTACHNNVNGEGAKPERPRQEKGWKVAVIVGPLAAQCRGLGPWSILSFSSLPPAPAVSYAFDWSPLGFVALYQSRAESTSSEPPTRPPRA